MSKTACYRAVQRWMFGRPKRLYIHHLVCVLEGKINKQILIEEYYDYY